MIINHKNKVVFLKNPKTAGTSIRESCKLIIENNFFDDDIIVKFRNSFFGEKEIKINFSYRSIEYLDFDLTGYSIYVVVRNPVERYMSACQFLRTRLMHPLLFQEELKEATKKEKEILFPYLRKGPVPTTGLSKNTKKILGDVTVDQIANKLIEFPFLENQFLDLIRIPQNFYFSDQRVIPIDFKNIQEEFDRINNLHNLGAEPLQVLNVSEKLESDVFSPETVEKIKNIYKEDVEFYSKLGTNK